MKKPKEVKEKKLTMKEKILRFVESKGSARFTDIQRFIVDDRSGEGTYDKGKCYETFHKYNHDTHEWAKGQRKTNMYRGVYCSSLQRGGHLRTGKQYLEKKSDGLYYTVRNGVWKPLEKKWGYGRYRYSNSSSGISSTYAPFPTESIKEDCKVKEECKIDDKKIIIDIEQHPINSEVIYDSNGERYIGILKNDEPIFFHRTETKLSDCKGKLTSTFPEVPKYCRYCAHELDPSHFKADKNGMTPNYCHWCGHIL